MTFTALLPHPPPLSGPPIPNAPVPRMPIFHRRKKKKKKNERFPNLMILLICVPENLKQLSNDIFFP